MRGVLSGWQAIWERLRREGMAFWLPLVLGAGLLLVLSYTILELSLIVPLGVLAGLFGTLFFFVQPGLSLLLFFALRILLDLMWWIPGKIGGLNLLQLFTAGATVLCGALFALEFRRSERHPTLNAFILFCAVLGISAVRNLDVGVGVELVARFASPPLMIFLTAGFLYRKEDRQRLMLVLLLVSLAPLLSSLFFLATGQMHQNTLAGYNRLLGGYKNLRHHGMMMMLIASIGVFWFYQLRDVRLRGAMLGYIAGAALCLYLTYIRTGLLAFAAFVACFLYFSDRKRELTATFALGGLAILASPEIQDRFKDLILVFSIDDEMFLESRKLGSGRVGLWTDSFKAYLSQPLGDIILGLGLGGHWELTQEAYNPFVEVQDGRVDTHSDYLGLLYQLGPIALGAYLYMQWLTVLHGFRLARDRAVDPFTRDLGALAAALSIAVFITNTISNGFVNRTTLGWLFWGVAGIMFAASVRLQVAREQQQDQTIRLRTREQT